MRERQVCGWSVAKKNNVFLSLFFLHNRWWRLQRRWWRTPRTPTTSTPWSPPSRTWRRSTPPRRWTAKQADKHANFYSSFSVKKKKNNLTKSFKVFVVNNLFRITLDTQAGTRATTMNSDPPFLDLEISPRAKKQNPPLLVLWGGSFFFKFFVRIMLAVANGFRVCVGEREREEGERKRG